MLRKVLGVAAALMLPGLLAAQAPASPAPAAVKPAAPHGIAIQVQGEVVNAAEAVEGLNNQEGVDEANGENNDGEFDAEHEGVDEPDGLNNDVNVGEQVDQAGEKDEGGDTEATPAPPASAGQIGQIGRHKP
ncbi:MAG TPA: hypothetical protein VN908_10285 [Gemmatimonadales bacterium]|nr:hypothetical protein [Gemmatimonadales bacterium]